MTMSKDKPSIEQAEQVICDIIEQSGHVIPIDKWDLIRDIIAAALEVAEQRGMDKVLSRVPSKKEFYDKLDTTTDYIGLDNTPINTDSFYDWILAKLKEPT